MNSVFPQTHTFSTFIFDCLEIQSQSSRLKSKQSFYYTGFCFFFFFIKAVYLPYWVFLVLCVRML